MVEKVPRNQEILVDPHGLPGVYMVRVVATLQGNMSSSKVSAVCPYVVNKKSSLVESVFSPLNELVAGSDGGVNVAADVSSCNGKAGSGECLPQVPEGGLPYASTSQGNDLQAEEGSRPVENPGNQVDTKDDKMAKGDKGKFSENVKKIM